MINAIIRHAIKLGFLFSLLLSSAAWANLNCLATWSDTNSRDFINNPSFENDLTDWSRRVDFEGVTTSIDNTIFHTGTKSLRVNWDGYSASQNYYSTYQTPPILPSVEYQLSAYIKADGITCERCNIESIQNWNALGLEVRIVKLDGTATWVSIYSKERVHGTSDWVKVVKRFVMPADAVSAEVRVRRMVGDKDFDGDGIGDQSGKSYGTGWWDDIQLVPVPRIDNLQFSNGQLIISGVNFGVDPIGQVSGENCVLIGAQCLDGLLVQSWSDQEIVVDNTADKIVRVRSGGIISNRKSLKAPLSLVNSSVTIDFAEGYTGIQQITDNASLREFLDSNALAPLYKVKIKNDNLPGTVATVVDAFDVIDLTYSQIEQANASLLTITGEHCGFSVDAKITLPYDSAQMQYTVDVYNNTSNVIQSVRYPVLAAKSSLGATSTDDAIVIPYFEGYLLKDPKQENFTKEHKDIEYPGPMALQMMAYYDDESKPGLYFSMDDNAGHKKRFGVEKVAGGLSDYLLFSFSHHTEEETGNQLLLSYNVNIDLLEGDWYDAADKYKQWAETTPWMQTRLQDRTDIPSWLYDVDIMIDCYKCKPNDFPGLINIYEDALGVDNVIIYPGGFWGINSGSYDLNGTPINVSWSGVDYFHDNPVYIHGEETEPLYPELKQSISQLRDRNDDVLLFIEGMFWDQYYFGKTDLSQSCDLNQHDPIPGITFFDDRNDFYNYANDMVAMKENGNDYYYFSWAISKSEELKDLICRKTATMCVGVTDNNRTDLAIYNNIKRGIDHGARLMSLDAIVGGRLKGCWNPNHGHPIGEGKWTHDRFISMLSDINNIIIDKNVQSQFGFAMENANELYLPHMQFQYVRDSALSKNGGNKKIPLFNYIYKEYYLGVERGYGLGWNNNLARWSLAIDFVQGNIQGTMIASDGTYATGLVDFYKNITAAKNADFYRGSMLRPPSFTGLPSEIRLGDYFYAEPVVTSVLKTSDSSISYLLVNSKILDDTGANDHTIGFEATQYDLADQHAVVTIYRNGIKENSISAQLPEPMAIDLSPGDVVEVRVETDRDVDTIPDRFDNCPSDDNPNQTDTDSDGIGNVCDIELLVDPVTSIDAEDGNVKESGYGTGVGGSVSVYGSTPYNEIRIGDTWDKKQYKGFVSFDVASAFSGMLAGTKIMSAQLQLTQSGSVSKEDVFSLLGPAWVNMSVGGFSGNLALEASDFEDYSMMVYVGIGQLIHSGFDATADIDAQGLIGIEDAIETNQRVQIRIEFMTPANSSGTDVVPYYSGGTYQQQNFPRLILEYTLPD